MHFRTWLFENDGSSRKACCIFIFRVVVTAIFSLFVNTAIFAWDGHFSLTYMALKNMPEISRKAIIPAETLTAFLKKERTGLVKLLKENEVWSRKNIPYYPPVPHDLVFKGDDSKPLKIQFIKAIRINSASKFPLFIQYPPGVKHRIHSHSLVWTDVMLPPVAKARWVYVPNPPFEGLLSGEKVSPLEIISSASDEPDYGMDINLWRDSPSWFAKEGHWGKELFGDPAFLLGSQAPFHMGFYYESPLLYKLAPFLKYTYLEYRLHLFMVLSQYAFKTGHPYWGYRFLGWSIHYAQDLTQPYHTTAIPNTSVIKLIGVNLLGHIGYRTAQRNLIKLIANRHFTLEHYTYYLVKHMLETNQMDNRVIQALADERKDSHYPAYTDTYPRVIIAKESHAMADRVDKEIRKIFPEKYVADPNYTFSGVVDLFKIMQDHHPEKDMDIFNKDLAKLLGACGAHTRNIVRHVLNLRPTPLR